MCLLGGGGGVDGGVCDEINAQKFESCSKTIYFRMSRVAAPSYANLCNADAVDHLIECNSIK